MIDKIKIQRPASAASYPGKKAVINDIRPTRTHKPVPKTAPPPQVLSQEKKKSFPKQDDHFIGRNKRRFRYFNWKGITVLLLIVSLLLAGYGVLISFSSMTVVAAKNNTFQLKKSVTLRLPKETVAFTDQITKVFPSETKTKISKKASGDILVYNSFSSAPQLLVARTRFESPDGKTYRIAENISVPGAVIKDGNTTPSSIQVRIYADEPGKNYNISEPVDFTIPGFKDSLRYTKFYARSVSSIDGGVDGEMDVVGESEVLKAVNILEDELKTQLHNKLNELIPEGFTTPVNAENVSILLSETNPAVGAAGKEFNVTVKGRATTTIIKQEAVEKALEDILFDDFPQERNYLQLLSHEGLRLTDSKDEGGTTIAQLEMQGKVMVAWMPDITSLKKDLIKGNVDDIVAVFRNYESIESANVIFFPSWLKRIPSKEEKIHVSIE